MEWRRWRAGIPHGCVANKCCAALLLVLAGGVLGACSDDDDPWASYRQDLVDVRTNASGNVALLQTDNGELFSVTNDWATRRHDTLYRAFALYVPAADGTANLRQLTDVLTDVPRRFAEAALKADPVGVQAVWRGGRYLNFQLSVPVSAGQKAHYFGFADGGRRTNGAGTSTLSLFLYHDRNGDGRDYTRKAWICCLLEGSGLEAGDSIDVAYCPEAGITTHLRVAY